MLILPFRENTREQILKAALQTLKKGGIVAYPTESFYALGVIAHNEAALKNLYKLKKRPLEKALPLIIGYEEILQSIVKSVPSRTAKFMKKFWPGALTIIFDAADGLPELLSGRTNKIAVRIPGRSFALYLARAARFPITATSANPSGRFPAQTPDKIIEYFGENIDLIIDGGKTPGGKPSTIIDITVTPPQILREGSILL